MTDRPILFSGTMVCAILDWRKTQTRRVLTPQPEHLQVYDWKGTRLHDSEYRHWCWRGHVGADNWADITTQLRAALPYAAGDRLWVRETCRAAEDPETGVDHVAYAADGGKIDIDNTEEAADRWCTMFAYRGGRGITVPPIHMPRWASRLTLIVEDVRVQRLQEISEKDIRAEGAITPEWEEWREDVANIGMPEGSVIESERDVFARLWNSINAKRGYGWETDPWVVAVTFRTIKQNIDAIERNTA